jgi:hypothetical protein
VAFVTAPELSVIAPPHPRGGFILKPMKLKLQSPNKYLFLYLIFYSLSKRGPSKLYKLQAPQNIYPSLQPPPPKFNKMLCPVVQGMIIGHAQTEGEKQIFST